MRVSPKAFAAASEKLEADFQSCADGPAGENRDVVGLAALLVEKILSLESKRHSAAEEETEPSADTSDAFVVDPVVTKLWANESARVAILRSERRQKRNPVVVDPVGCARHVERGWPPAVSVRSVDAVGVCRNL